MEFKEIVKTLKDHLKDIPKGALSRANIRDVLVAYCDMTTREANDFVSKFGVSGTKDLIKYVAEDDPATQVEQALDSLQPNEILIYETKRPFGRMFLKIRRNDQYPDQFVLWNEDKDGDISDIVEHSSKENAVTQVVQAAQSYKPKKLKNKYLRYMDEDWEVSPTESKYLDTYFWKDNTNNSIELHELMASLKEEIDGEINNDKMYVNIILVPSEGRSGSFQTAPIFNTIDTYYFQDIDGIPASELLTPNFCASYGYDFESLTENAQKEVQEIYDTLVAEIKEINTKLPAILKPWGFHKLRSASPLKKSFNESYVYTNKHGQEVVDLEYPDLHYEASYGPRDWETGVGTREIDTEIEYTYTVDKDSVEEFLAEFIMDKEPEYDAIGEDDDKAYAWIDDHFDQLMDKYEEDILEHFRRDAEEEAAETEYPEDHEYYPDYDDYDD